MKVARIDQTNREHIDAFIASNWYTTQMVVHGESIDLGCAEGFCAYEGDGIVGLAIYRLLGSQMEVLSLDSLREGCGIGTALLDACIEEARANGVTRVFLVTTNDNTRALRFYQRRGFDMVALHRNAVDRARELKPEIPRVGMEGIPLRHEIELQLTP